MNRSAPRRLQRLPLWLGLCVSATACVGNSASGVSEPPPTEVTVEPEQFDPTVPCAEGALQRYVATLVRVDDGASADGGESDPVSSPPISCHEGVAFGDVVVGAEYIAEIDGYDHSDLRAESPGQRPMLDGDGDPATPRWQATCGVDLTALRTGAPLATSGTARGGDAGAATKADGGAPEAADSGTTATAAPNDAGAPAELTEPAPSGGPALVLDQVSVPLIGCTPFVE